MIVRRYGGLSLLALACAAGSYFATYAVQQGRDSAPPAATAAVSRGVIDWLGLTAEQAASLQDIEQRFNADQALLEARLSAERELLAAMFESSTTTDAEFLQQVEAVIDAHDSLERRIAAHLVELRPRLTTEQQRRLFNRFASSVREGNRYGWRYGQSDETRGGRRGGGPPPGRGRGGPPEGRGRRGDTPAPSSRPSWDEP